MKRRNRNPAITAEDSQTTAFMMEAALRILQAYESGGACPRRVVRARRNLRREWPELAGQLDLLVALTHHDPEPVQ